MNEIVIYESKPFSGPHYCAWMKLRSINGVTYKKVAECESAKVWLGDCYNNLKPLTLDRIKELVRKDEVQRAQHRRQFSMADDYGEGYLQLITEPEKVNEF